MGNWARESAAAVLAIGMGLSASALADKTARIVGEAAGERCETIAVAVLRLELDYPMFGWVGGWSRGVPKISENTIELYLYRPAERKLSLAASVKAPRRWRDSSAFDMSPRILPGGEVIFRIRGCPKGSEGCSESKMFRLGERGKLQELSQWPEVSAEESANFRECVAYRTYGEGGDSRVFVSTGPTGGPWKRALAFDGKELAPAEEETAKGSGPKKP